MRLGNVIYTPPHPHPKNIYLKTLKINGIFGLSKHKKCNDIQMVDDNVVTLYIELQFNDWGPISDTVLKLRVS
jgi:hypothetical protein